MTRGLLFSLCFLSTLWLLPGCDGCSKKEDSNNTTECDGAPPLAELQEGVCAGVVKACVLLSEEEGHAWVEPDYSQVEGYETTEFSCDERDNDCDGEPDEDLLRTFYADADGDSFGDSEASVVACWQPLGYVVNSLDCDDTNENIRTSCRTFCRLLDPTVQHIPVGSSTATLSVGVFSDGLTTETGDATGLIVEIG
ncbi:MAG: hypothetical protein KKD63_16900, partial [Proteobacteria bacterium]|nr:hypothetical protein [Pseudomonadota bacterium]